MYMTVSNKASTGGYYRTTKMLKQNILHISSFLVFDLRFVYVFMLKFQNVQVTARYTKRMSAGTFSLFDWEVSDADLEAAQELHKI